ncbi:MAG: hypothetical protein SGPRY_007931 [Prymnesium sp.]
MLDKTSSMALLPPSPVVSPSEGTAEQESPGFELLPIASPRELSLIDQLRSSLLREIGVDELPTDRESRALFAPESLLRFVRARSSIDASTKMILASHKWRQEYGFFDNMQACDDDNSDEAEYLRTNWPSGCHGFDKRGVPVYYARHGASDMANAVSVAGFDRFLRFNLRRMHEGWQGIDKASEKYGKHLVTMVCVSDMEGLQLRTALRGVSAFRRMSAVLDSNFPEKLHVVRPYSTSQNDLHCIYTRENRIRCLT